MKDDAGVVQLWTVSPRGSAPRQVTGNETGVTSAITWSPDGRRIAHVMDGSVCMTDIADGRTTRLTPRRDGTDAPLPFACVFSPDGRAVAYMRNVAAGGATFSQIFVVTLSQP
jgi:Tol biopolymer transport system component